MCDWVTLLYSKKLTEHCRPAIMEKKIIKNPKKKKKKKVWEVVATPKGGCGTSGTWDALLSATLGVTHIVLSPTRGTQIMAGQSRW